MKKALITGPTGAAGISLIQELQSHGIEVGAVCRVGSRRIGNIRPLTGVTIIERDLKDLLSLADELPRDFDAFYHFAWDGTYGEARLDLHLQTNNIYYTLDAVHLAKALGCSVFIGAGSQSEFGHVDGVLHPYMPCSPDNGYGVAKLAASQMSRIECRKLGIHHIWCRIISLYGPYDGDYTLVMSTILSMLAGNRMQFTKGDQIWDYLYSKDAARAFRLVVGRGKDGSIYCLGSGKTRLLRDYIYAIRDAIDPSMAVGIDERDYYPNQVMHLEADISNLTEDTGFTPQYTFEEGIRETIQWVKGRF